MSEEQVVIGIYLRVSTRKQETHAQRQAIDKWIRGQGYPKAELIWYEDKGLSGKTFDRPQFQRLMEDVRQGKVSKLVTFESSRLSRNFLAMLNVMQTLTEHGVIVEVPDSGHVEFDNVIDKFIVSAKALVAQQERELTSKRIKEGLAAAKAKGKRLGCPPGERRKLGKQKQHDPQFVDRLLRLSNKLSCRGVASEMGISPATVSRLRKRYSDEGNHCF